MNVGKSPKGYTIVEVMIFLAVSGFMFIMAAAFISGKQAKATFREGMNQLNASTQQVINDVANGYYPSTENFSCTANQSDAAPSTPAITNLTTKARGTNQGCVFLGKVMQFGITNVSSSERGYNVYSVIGRQYQGTTSSGKVITSFSDAKPRVMQNPIDLTDYKSFKGPVLTQMTNNGSPISAIGIFNSFGNYQSPTTLASGGQNLIVVVVPGTLPDNLTGSVSTIQSALNDSNIASNINIAACFEGGDNSYGKLTIGGPSGQRLTTRVQVGESPIGGC